MRTVVFFLLIFSVVFASCGHSKKTVSKTTPLEGTYWKLTVLAGTTITNPRAGAKEVFLQIKAEDSTISGNGGCNGFGGKFASATEKIKFSNIISTMMACDGMEAETAFFRALENTDSYSIKGDTLRLLRARMAPLAKLIAVAGK